jgi:preprotein translocase subunit SecG
MTRRERMILMTASLLVALLLLMPDIRAQLQQSGGPGSSVTAAQGSAAALSSAWPT